VALTAPMMSGMSVLSSGDYVGDSSRTYLHLLPLPAVPKSGEGGPSLVPSNRDVVARFEPVMGDHHLVFLMRAQLAKLRQRSPASESRNRSNTSTKAHIIPNEPDDIYMDSIQATVIYQNATWSPVPARSLGFCAGPFSVVEDAEYFASNPAPDRSSSENGEDTDVSDSDRDRKIQQARRRGHGIRQYFLCPIYERKLVHLHADASLLPGRFDLRPRPLTARQREQTRQLRAAVQASTVGVPLRALRLMRDVLALPSFRTWSHTQVWIPDCVSGGATCGALHTCPEVSVNGFLGWSLLDSRLLPPPGSRLPFHQGGRVLQFVQARAAIRGWLTSALPLGGQDDVGNGYIHSVTESFLMSLYERAHGAHGEGSSRMNFFSLHCAFVSKVRIPAFV
jgi:hypothetical protein